ncbi:DUF2141 domain-containing protein [Sneathiella marina]|uniref:DUF2141 domain-containing protein n=1 Tax=Sneathiella marina TaxID=2950108 RepID=A0ABY4W428_9PROT|nr:DUF2141 domain-containing protein [Sneathiella marina]USG61955.1 DUF2141 domain-containing protein [Sneathiella marina]
MNRRIRKRVSNITASMTVAAAIGAFTVSFAAAADLRVNVQGIRSSDGTIRIALHDGEKGFPKDRKPVAAQAQNAVPGSLVFIFSGLQPGNYAVTLFHDENGNEKLDSNLFGIPTEGYGFSNNARGSLGPPSFVEAVIEIKTSNVANDVTIEY